MAHGHMVRLAALALLALPLAAGAADSDAHPAFDAVDANGDGTISLEEARAAGVPENEFEREDIDQDGALTPADWYFVDMDPAATSGASP